jgi:hypothetical protein
MFPKTPKIPVIVQINIGDTSQTVEILRIKGAQWKDSNPVFLDETAAEGYQCRYLLGNGQGPIHSLSFMVEFTGKGWDVDRNTGEFVSHCRIIVPRLENGLGLAETFPGKIWVKPV